MLYWTLMSLIVHFRKIPKEQCLTWNRLTTPPIYPSWPRPSVSTVQCHNVWSEWCQSAGYGSPKWVSQSALQLDYLLHHCTALWVVKHQLIIINAGEVKLLHCLIWSRLTPYLSYIVTHHFKSQHTLAINDSSNFFNNISGNYLV